MKLKSFRRNNAKAKGLREIPRAASSFPWGLGVEMGDGKVAASFTCIISNLKRVWLHQDKQPFIWKPVNTHYLMSLIYIKLLIIGLFSSNFWYVSHNWLIKIHLSHVNYVDFFTSWLRNLTVFCQRGLQKLLVMKYNSNVSVSATSNIVTVRDVWNVTFSLYDHS